VASKDVAKASARSSPCPSLTPQQVVDQNLLVGQLQKLRYLRRDFIALVRVPDPQEFSVPALELGEWTRVS